MLTAVVSTAAVETEEVVRAGETAGVSTVEAPTAGARQEAEPTAAARAVRAAVSQGARKAAP